MIKSIFNSHERGFTRAPKTGAGFTLVELLVVIVIIAILAVIGFAVLGSQTGNARDARRKADIEEITKAYELNYNQETGLYQPIAANQFTSGKIPQSPEKTDYLNSVSTDSKSYTVCALLEAAKPSSTVTAATCTPTADNCFCRTAAQGSLGGGSSPTTCPAFKNVAVPGGTQSCRAINAVSFAAVTNPFIKCTDIPSGSTIDCSLTPCGAAGSSATVPYYTSATAPTAATDRIVVSAAACGSPTTVTLR